MAGLIMALALAGTLAKPSARTMAPFLPTVHQLAEDGCVWSYFRSDHASLSLFSSYQSLILLSPHFMPLSLFHPLTASSFPLSDMATNDVLCHMNYSVVELISSSLTYYVTEAKLADTILLVSWHSGLVYYFCQLAVSLNCVPFRVAYAIS